MKCAVLYYNGFGQFEVSVALSSLSPRAEIIGLALEKKPIFSEDKQLFLPQMQIGEIAAEDIDVLLVPGGDILPLHHRGNSGIRVRFDRHQVLAIGRKGYMSELNLN